MHRKERKTPESKQTKTLAGLIKYFSGEGGIIKILNKDLLIFSSQMGSPCKRGHGGKIEGCGPAVDNERQRSVDKANATVSILLTRLTEDVFLVLLEI